MKKNIIITILSILVISLSGYILYDKAINNNNKTIINSDNNELKQQDNIVNNNQILPDKNPFENNYSDNDNNNIQNQSNISEIKNNNIKLYEEIIENDLLKLLGNNSLKDISNQDLLEIVFEMYKNEYGWKKEILLDDLMQIKEKSVLKNTNIEYAKQLQDYTAAYNYTDSIIYEFDSSIQKYIYQEVGHSKSDISIIHKELVNKYINNNEITLSYKFVFVRTTSNSVKTAPGYHYLYHGYDNILNNVNNLNGEKHFKEFSFMDMDEEIGRTIAYDKAKSYVIDNYDSIKNKLYTYTFVFSYEDNILVLKDYYRE